MRRTDSVDVSENKRSTAASTSSSSSSSSSSDGLTGSMRVRNEYKRASRRSHKLDMEVRSSDIQEAYGRVSSFEDIHTDFMIVAVLPVQPSQNATTATKVIGVLHEGKGGVDRARTLLENGNPSAAALIVLRCRTVGLWKSVYICYLGMNEPFQSNGGGPNRYNSIFSDNGTLLLTARNKVKPLLHGIALSFEVETLRQLTAHKLNEKLYVLRSSEILILRVWCPELNELIRVHFEKNATLAKLRAQCKDRFSSLLSSSSSSSLVLYLQHFNNDDNSMTVTPLVDDAQKLVDLLVSYDKIYVKRGSVTPTKADSTPRKVHYEEDPRLFKAVQQENALELKRTISDAQSGKKYNVMSAANGIIKHETKQQLSDAPSLLAPSAAAVTPQTKKKHTKQTTESNDEQQSQDNVDSSDDNVPASARPEEWWELSNEDIVIAKHAVARGKTAICHMAFWGAQLIALKEATGRLSSSKVQKPFRDEFNILRKLEHKNVVQLIGIIYEPKLSLATEWVARGDLYHVLRKTEIKFTLRKVVEMMFDIASGLAYLHQQKIVSRDIKSHNLLVTEAFEVKLADMGFSINMRDEDRKHGFVMTGEDAEEMAWTAIGTKGWVAPEVLDASYEAQGYNGTQADVFSMGIVLWELISRQDNPLLQLGIMQYIDTVKEGKNMPPMPDYCPGKLADVISSCWAWNGAERPSSEAVVESLRLILEDEGLAQVLDDVTVIRQEED